MWKEKAVSQNYEARDDFSNGGDERRYRKPSVEQACREKNRMLEMLRERQDAGENCFIPNNILVLHEACHVALETIHFVSSALPSIPTMETLTLR